MFTVPSFLSPTKNGKTNANKSQFGAEMRLEDHEFGIYSYNDDFLIAGEAMEVESERWL